MKSTYNILSSNLDQKSQANNILIVLFTTDDINLYNYSEDNNLFDYPYCKRIINVSELLSQNIEIIINRIYHLNNLKELLVKLHYLSPLVSSNKLVMKRTLQAINALQENLPNVVFKIAIDITLSISKFKK